MILDEAMIILKTSHVGMRFQLFPGMKTMNTGWRGVHKKVTFVS